MGMLELQEAVGSPAYAAGYEEGFFRGSEETKGRHDQLLEANNRYLEANNRYLEEARAARREVKRLKGILTVLSVRPAVLEIDHSAREKQVVHNGAFHVAGYALTALAGIGAGLLVAGCF